MKLSIGIVGLPNVGKSTLFNALLKKQVAFAANYPFATIEPNVGVVEVPDERLPVLAKIVNTQKIVHAIVEFYDIAGLVKGASTGEGLGNKFLSHIREVAAIVHVVRLFDDNDVIHVANKVDPLDDIKTVETELILADLDTIHKQKEPKGKASKEEIFTYEVTRILKEKLNDGILAKNAGLDEDQLAAIQQLNLLTMKPILYVFNVSETQLDQQENTKEKIEKIISSSHPELVSGSELLTKQMPKPHANALGKPVRHDNFIYLNAKLENEVLTLPEEEQKEYLAQYHLEETGLNRLIKKAYEMLGLISFLTAGELEARAWTIKKGMLAPDAAGVIHTDFIKHFIKADIVSFEDFVALGGWVKARDQGKVQIVGKDHEMKDGDVVEFKIGQ